MKLLHMIKALEYRFVIHRLSNSLKKAREDVARMDADSEDAHRKMDEIVTIHNRIDAIKIRYYLLSTI